MANNKFNALIQYVDGLLCEDTGISTIHIPALVTQHGVSAVELEPVRQIKVKMKDMHRPVRKKIEYNEIESREQLSGRMSKKPYIIVKCFAYTGGVQVIVRLYLESLIEIRRHFINDMEMTGFRGAAIDREGGWWSRYYLEMYFTTQRLAETAIAWIYENYIKGRPPTDLPAVVYENGSPVCK
jgi:hypothetical protein